MPLFAKNIKVIQPCEKCGKSDGAKFYYIKSEWHLFCDDCKPKKTVADKELNEEKRGEEK